MTHRRLETAELLAVGAELLVGETRDTNSGDLARELTALGVEVLRLSALPDRLDAVADALRGALAHADLALTTGGLGPTPDDLTREAIAAVCGVEPYVDPTLEAWLRGMFERRGLPYSTANQKQAWLIPGATSLPNPNGTAPGWWVDLPDGRVIVALPGPPREMGPMWRDEVLPRLRAAGLGADRAAETLRLSGIGESMLVDVIGEETLRQPNPEVATYARVDAVDVRVSATGAAGRTAREMVDAEVERLWPALGRYVFARGDEGWPTAIARRLGDRTVALLEVGTGAQLAGMIGAEPWARLEEVRPAGAPDALDPQVAARAVRERGGCDIGVCLVAEERVDDTAVRIAITDGVRATIEDHVAFLGGEQGRRRAANIACMVLWRWLEPAG
ncbi:MAG: competence/damage-inducible protein A [Chloroflexi bacterium]|nr:competence/damage-inducible protein A [Chloroflexota bacterium]